MKTKKTSHNQGQCPFCGCEDLHYGETDYDRGDQWHQYTAWECPECGGTGVEYIETVEQFRGHKDLRPNKLEGADL